MAITEYYVSATGNGSQDGTLGNDLTWAGMITQINGLGAGGAAGRRYNVKGTHARTTTTDTLTVGGTLASPLIIRGYSTTIDDGNQGRVSDNGSLVTTNFPVITYTSGRFVSSTYTIIENIDFSANALNNYVVDVGVNSIVHHCKLGISGTGGGSARCIRLDGAAASLIDCDVVDTATTSPSAVLCANAGQRILANRISNTNGASIISSNTYAMVVGNIIFNSTTGISLTSTSANGTTVLVWGNTFYNCTSECILLPNSVAADDLPVVMNNHMQDNQQALDSSYVGTGDLPIWWSYNREDNTSSSAGFTDWQAATNIGNITTATATEYISPASGDFNLLDTAAAINAGIPKYLSIGALQKQFVEATTIVRRF